MTQRFLFHQSTALMLLLLGESLEQAVIVVDHYEVQRDLKCLIFTFSIEGGLIYDRSLVERTSQPLSASAKTRVMKKSLFANLATFITC